MKRCWKCKETKSEDMFYKDRGKKGGLSGECKLCHNDSSYQESYYLLHKDKLLPRHRISAKQSYERKRARDGN